MDLALNNLQSLICLKTNQTNMHIHALMLTIMLEHLHICITANKYVHPRSEEFIVLQQFKKFFVRTVPNGDPMFMIHSLSNSLA